MADYQQDPVNYGSTTQTGVAFDEGLRSYMLGIYNYMALGIAGTAIITLLVMGAAVVKQWLDLTGSEEVSHLILLIKATALLLVTHLKITDIIQNEPIALELREKQNSQVAVATLQFSIM